MAEMTLTADDMEELVRRLDDMEPALDERQRTLLRATFSLANEALEARSQGEVAGFALPPTVTGIVVSTPTAPTGTPLDDKGAGGGKTFLQFDLTEVYVTSISWSD